MYKSIESLSCAPGINIVLDVNYTSKINKLIEKYKWKKRVKKLA